MIFAQIQKLEVIANQIDPFHRETLPSILTHDEYIHSGQAIQQCMAALGVEMTGSNFTKAALFHDGKQAMMVIVAFEWIGRAGDFPLVPLEQEVVDRLDLHGLTLDPRWQRFKFDPQLVSLDVDDKGRLFQLIFGMQ